MTKSKFKNLIKGNIVLLIAIVCAIVSSFFVGIDKEYLRYIDYKTITCLFCMLASICALRNIYFFRFTARKIVEKFSTTRSAILALVFITFIGSMLISNDMALITFLPLGYIVLSSTNQTKHIAFTFIMQNVAANLGGMLTPFGNPQNLYLFSFFNIPTGEFLKIMLAPFLVSVIMILSICLFVKKEKLNYENEMKIKLHKPRLILYLLLFAFSIIIVFKFIPYWVGLIVVLLTLLIFDRKALRDVDYSLLFTFVAFFIFAGNIARIDAVSNFLAKLLEKNVLIFGVFSCQFISNVPSSILLSKFTQDYPSLLRAVNIGGVGTLISSLASLISFKEFAKCFPNQKLKYVAKFSLINFSFLAVLIVTCLIF